MTKAFVLDIWRQTLESSETETKNWRRDFWELYQSFFWSEIKSTTFTLIQKSSFFLSRLSFVG